MLCNQIKILLSELYTLDIISQPIIELYITKNYLINFRDRIYKVLFYKYFIVKANSLVIVWSAGIYLYLHMRIIYIMLNDVFD
jgi:hypothetical protein